MRISVQRYECGKEYKYEITHEMENRPYSIKLEDAEVYSMKMNCDKCEYARVTPATEDWAFIGCCHEPYERIWTVEIKDCPKNDVTYEKVEDRH